MKASDGYSLKTLLAEIGDDPGVADLSLPPRVRSALDAMAATIDAQRRQLAILEEQASRLEHLADRDPLLDIFNRRAFERELARTAAYVERYGSPASLVFLDLNKFKWINDVYGHKAGDVVLQHVAAILQANIRNSDTLGRLGGDEFAIILVQADLEAATAKADRLEALVATTPVDIDDTTILLTASAGASTITDAATLSAHMEEADAVMYERKAIYHAGDSR